MKPNFVVYYDRFDGEAKLPIFKSVSNLSKEVILRLSKIENSYKPMFCPLIVQSIEMMFKTIILANKSRGAERKEFLEEFLTVIFSLKINLRIMFESKILPIKAWSACIDLICDCEKQTINWIGSL